MVYIPSELPTFWGSGDLKSAIAGKGRDRGFFFWSVFPLPFSKSRLISSDKKITFMTTCIIANIRITAKKKFF